MEAGAECSLPGRRLAGSRLEDLAHEDLVDRRAVGKPRPLGGGSNGDSTKLDGRCSG
jgi:hypothetical protein